MLDGTVQKIDAILCDLMEKGKEEAVVDDSSLKMKLKD